MKHFGRRRHGSEILGRIGSDPARARDPGCSVKSTGNFTSIRAGAAVFRVLTGRQICQSDEIQSFRITVVQLDHIFKLADRLCPLFLLGIGIGAEQPCGRVVRCLLNSAVELGRHLCPSPQPP